MEKRSCRELIWGREELWVLENAGGPDDRKEREREREGRRERELTWRISQEEKLFPRTTDWEKERG